MKEFGLYIHIPFCVRRCRYCDFVSCTGGAEKQERYFCALEREMRARAASRPVTSVFVGGGTPTVLSPALLDRLFLLINKYYNITPGAEFTVECNPGTADPGKMKHLADGGVNRLSIGLQSTSDELLRRIGRIHTYRDFLDTLDAAHAAGIRNVNADLICGLPGMTAAAAEKTARTVAALPLTHASVYSLILEENTPLYADAAAGTETLPSDDETADMSEIFTDVLAEAGFVRYEISNYARPGYECRHNSLYWRRGDYLGLGAAAHSLIGDLRRENTPDIDAYIDGAEASETTVPERDAAFETIMLALRTRAGLDVKAFTDRFGGFTETQERAAAENIERGNLVSDGETLRATKRGADILNTVLLDFLD